MGLVIMTKLGRSRELDRTPTLPYGATRALHYILFVHLNYIKGVANLNFITPDSNLQVHALRDTQNYLLYLSRMFSCIA